MAQRSSIDGRPATYLRDNLAILRIFYRISNAAAKTEIFWVYITVNQRERKKDTQDKQTKSQRQYLSKKKHNEKQGQPVLFHTLSF